MAIRANGQALQAQNYEVWLDNIMYVFATCLSTVELSASSYCFISCICHLGFMNLLQ